MHFLYNCKGELVAKYCTRKGLKIGIGRRWRALWAEYETTPVSERKQYNIIYYTQVEFKGHYTKCSLGLVYQHVNKGQV